MYFEFIQTGALIFACYLLARIDDAIRNPPILNMQLHPETIERLTEYAPADGPAPTPSNN